MADAAALAVQYESIRFADVQREVLHLFPAPPARVLDIGAGTRRDAAALAQLGYAVVAVDALEREEAMAAVAELVGEGGRVSLSLRHGPVPEGRRMFDVSAGETGGPARSGAALCLLA